jgi:hypothetical protein
MSYAILKYVIGVGVSCALAISYSNPSKAFPALTDTAVVKTSLPNVTTNVRYYGRGYGYGRDRYYGHGGAAAAGILGGLAAGAIVGSIAANNGYYYGQEPYAYSPGPYGAYAYDPGPYDQGPAYYGGTHYYYTSPAYAPYKHWTEF